MKKLVLGVIVAVSMSGCAMIPSFWDDNENKSIVIIVKEVDRIDCEKKDFASLYQAKSETEWLLQYASLKGSKDIHSMVSKLETTMDPLVTKAKSGDISTSYCDLKKKVLQNDSKRIAKAMLGRF